jgi:excisionase family DNA binding protein
MTQRKDDDERLTKQQAADQLGVGVRTVERMIERGDLAVVRPTPGTVRIPQAAVTARLTPALADTGDSE